MATLPITDVKYPYQKKLAEALINPKLFSMAKLFSATQEIVETKIIGEDLPFTGRILLQQDMSKTIADFREKLKTKAMTDPYFKQCFDPWGKMRLTALLVCAMVDDLLTAKFLVEEMKVEVSPQDIRGWTPLHHAKAHKHNKLAQYLFEHMTKPQRHLKTRFGVTADDLTRFFSNDRGVGNKTVVLQQKLDDKLVPITREEFEEMTSVQYSRCMKMSFDLLMERWLADDQKDFGTEAYQQFRADFEKKYQKFRLDPTSLYIEKGKKALFAARSFEVHECIVPLAGTVETEDGFRVQIEKIGNEAVLTVHGFPNMYYMQIKKADGLSGSNVAVTIEKVQEGDQFCFETAMDNTRFGIYQNPRQKAMEVYFKERGPLERFKVEQKEFKKKKGNLTKEDLLRTEEWRSKLAYFYRNPGAILSLFLQRIIDIESICKCTPKGDLNIVVFQAKRKKKDYLSLALTLKIDSNNGYLENLEELFILLKNIHLKFKPLSKIFDKIAQSVLEKMKDTEVIYILYFLELLEDQYFERLKKCDDPTEIIKEVWRITYLKKRVQSLYEKECLDEKEWAKLCHTKAKLPSDIQQYLYEKLIDQIAGGSNIALNALAMKTFEPEDTQSGKTDT